MLRALGEWGWLLGPVPGCFPVLPMPARAWCGFYPFFLVYLKSLFEFRAKYSRIWRWTLAQGGALLSQGLTVFLVRERNDGERAICRDATARQMLPLATRHPYATQNRSPHTLGSFHFQILSSRE